MRLCNFLCYLFIPIIAVIGFTIPKSPCELCLFGVKNIDKFITTNKTQDFFKTILIKSCKAFPETAMKIVGEENSCQGKIDCDILCQGMINENFDELLDILTKTKLSPEEICGNIDLCVKNHTQHIIIPNNTLIKSNTSNHKNEKHFNVWNLSQGVGKILHITDIHLDLFYKENYNINCGLPICCRPDSTKISNKEEQLSGKYGSPYGKCDIPLSLLKGTLEFIKNNIEVDAIIYTGDGPAHDIWAQSRRYNFNINRAITNLFVYNFPNTSVTPIIGNHDTFPINQLDDNNISGWLYNSLGDIWSNWLSDDSIKTFKYGGFYTQLIKPGLRVITLNTNVYSKENWWQSLYYHSDFIHQFAWFKDVLEQSRNNNEKVIILAHHYPSSWFESQYVEYYKQLLIKYKDIITITLYGHEHNGPSLRMVYDENGPQMFGFVGGSLTTYSELNPAFTVYIYNRTNNEIIDLENWWTDLVETPNEINWKKRSNFIDLYGLNRFDLNNLNSFVSRFHQEPDMFKIYKTEYYRNVTQTSGGKNKIELYCEIISLSKEEYKACLNKYI